MKMLVSIVIAVAILAGLFMWFISDRDRGLWFLNTAINVVQSPNRVSDIHFGQQAWQKLDVYPQQNKSPVVIFVHGGSWRHGRKDQYYFAADAFIRLGYTVVVPDYIKYPDERARFPSFVDDAALALAWTKENIEQYNGDKDQVFMVGHSAGAHTALMIASDARFLSAVGLDQSAIRGVAGIAGPYSFIPDWEVTKAVFGPPNNYPNMDVLNFINGDEPSTLLLHSKDDAQVGQYNQEKVAELMRDEKVDVETLLYEGVDHIEMVLHLHPWFTKHANIAEDINRFFRARLTLPSASAD